MTRSHRAYPFFSAVSIVLVGFMTGCAENDAQVRDIDPEADSILKQMCETLDGAKALQLRVDASMDVRVETGGLAQFHRTSEITMARPDRLFSRTESDEGHWSVWYYGKTLTVMDWDENAFATETVPGRIDEMLDFLADEYDLIVPMADLLIGKTYDSLLADVETGEYIGNHLVGDVSCHHLMFSQENIDWQIWIDAGPTPLPRKLVITYTQEFDQPQYVANMDHWDLAPNISEATFAFSKPNGATQIPLEDLLADD